MKPEDPQTRREAIQSWLLASALLILLFSANQVSYAPKQGIHTLVHIAPTDALIPVVALLVLLPYVEASLPGRVVSWLTLAALGVGAFLLSEKGHAYVRVLQQGLHSRHAKGAVLATAILMLAGWHLKRLIRPSGAKVPGGGRVPFPSLPSPVWALLAVALLSAVTMVLPSESVHDWLQTPEGKEPIRKAALFLIELFQQLGIALFLFLVVLRSPGRVRLAVRTVLLSTVLCVMAALPQYIRFVRHPAASLPIRAAAQATASATDASNTTDHTGPRVEGLMQSRNAYGGYLCVALPLALGSLLGARRRSIRGLHAVVIAIALITILSGAAFWCSLLGLVITGLCYGGKKGRLAAAMAVGMGLLILVALPPNRHHVLEEFFRYRAPTAATTAATPGDTAAGSPGATGLPIRKEYVEWIAGIYMTSEHFWLGVGPGQYQLNIGQYYGQDPNPEVRLERDSNNLYFVYASSLGLAGLIALMQVIFWALARARKSARPKALPSSNGHTSDWPGWWSTPEGRAMACGVCGSLAAFLMINLFTSLLVRGTGILFAFLLALASSMYQGNEAPQSRS